MGTEIWKDVIGYEGLYQVSNIGRVKRLASTVHYRDGRVFHYKEALLNPRKTKDGYLLTSFSKNGVGKTHLIHRVVASHFVPNPLNKPVTNHLNGIRDDNRAGNLQWSTQSENVKYSFDVLGFKITEQTKRKISDKLKGKVFSAEHKRNVKIGIANSPLRKKRA